MKFYDSHRSPSVVNRHHLDSTESETATYSGPFSTDGIVNVPQSMNCYTSSHYHGGLPVHVIYGLRLGRLEPCIAARFERLPANMVR